MKIPVSVFLEEKESYLLSLLKLLSGEFPYCSILGTDVKGSEIYCSNFVSEIRDSFWNERGFAVRIFNEGYFFEYSFNEISENTEKTAKKIVSFVKEKKRFPKTIKVFKYKLPEEEHIKEKFEGKCSVNPFLIEWKEKIGKIKKLIAGSMKLSDLLIDFKVRYSENSVSKIFLSPERNLKQSYPISQVYLAPIVRKGGKTRYSYSSIGGMKGFEVIDEIRKNAKHTVEEAIDLLDSEKIIPGEYDVICSPEISGLVAHEAFGHGVESDMFVKNRAKAPEYLKKRIGSPLVEMHDGAKSARNQVASYLFDDEGTLGSDTVIIKKGILEKGLSDTLSAHRLGVKPTGNGRRQSYERKAYARMTNTRFGSGKSNPEEMIRNTKNGVLLSKTLSGMEDPKNWGIQCLVLIGKEISDGKLTGRVFSPVFMTGYVPDLLNNITMVSDTIEMSGSGACGKGYKEFVKVSDGGPYIKTRARLG